MTVEELLDSPSDLEAADPEGMLRAVASSAARPMNVREVDDLGNLWFLSPSDSHTNEQIHLDPEVDLYFQAAKHSDFLHLHGNATITTDRSKIRELWEPLLQTWFTEGQDDPRITVIEVTPTDGYYWDTKHNRVVQLAKMIAGAVTGKTLDDSVQGKLRV